MATLQRIRNHGVILIVIIGLAMLAFILGDFLNSSSSFANRGREYVGEIEGQRIHYTEYENAVEQLTEVYKIESGRSDFDEDMHAQIRNQVWQMLVAKYTLASEGDKIGMEVTSDELFELCAGANPHQLITSRRIFTNENGQFDRNMVINFLASLEQDSENPEMQANLKQASTYWNYWETVVRITAMQEKYVGLLQHLTTANNLDAKFAALARDSKVDADYVIKPYYTVADSLVTVKSWDIKKLYKARKSLYKQTPSRDIAYISFAIVPSEEDFVKAEQAMKELEEEFRTTDDVALVVNSSSDVMYDGRNYSEADVPEAYKEFAFGKGAKAGDFMPLLFDEATNTFRMARLVEAGYTLSDSVLLTGIAKNEGESNQEYGWFSENELQRSIAEPAFHEKIGSRFTVTLGTGEQTFEITNRTKPTAKVKLAIIEHEVTPSSKTYSAIYNEARQFVFANKTEEALRAAASEQGIEVLTANSLLKSTNKVADLKSSRAIVRWAFEAKEDQVSDVFECGDQYIVAVLTAAHDGTYRPLSEVEGALRYEVLNQKKAEYISAQVANVTDLNAAAETLGVEVRHVEGLTKDAYRFGNEGMEPAAVGAAFATAAGELSHPIEGNQGVILLVPANLQESQAEVNYTTEIANLNARISYSLPYQLLNYMEQQAQIEDNRFNFQ